MKTAPTAAPGSSPRGVQGEEQVSRYVRRMFDGVAPRYDFLNHLLSFQTDRYWRWRTVSLLRPFLAPVRDARPRVVDLCCGSGDLTIALQRASAVPVFGSDFSHRMLQTAQRKIGAKALPSMVFESDALRLPLPDASVHLVTAAFGFRNLANYRRGLEEMHRVLAPGGAAAILEFSTPPSPLFRRFYDFYSLRVLPRLGALFSNEPDAYEYLPESVRKFPGAEDLAAQMRHAGFADVRFHRMTFGMVALHIGIRT
ncbi:MAG: bifunctional demethylmenaquinone methyltransferase/2-methoxy-6-polyprenyl-1,4-benzoquinol methylase UbiE [Bryobacteraceae bacterium]